MKTSLSDKLFFCAAALALGILGQTRAQAQMGGVSLWTNRFNGLANSDDRASAIAVDGSGNVFVTGSSSGSGLDYATIKYSAAGVPLWTNLYNGPANGNDQAIAMAADSNGNVFVGGIFEWQRQWAGLCDDPVFGRGRGSVDKRLQRNGQR